MIMLILRMLSRPLKVRSVFQAYSTIQQRRRHLSFVFSHFQLGGHL